MNEIRITVPVPDKTYEALEASAKKNRRGVSREASVVLEDRFADTAAPKVKRRKRSRAA